MLWQARQGLIAGRGALDAAGGGGGGASAEVSQFFARTSGGAGGANAAAYTALIDGLVTDAVWTKLDALYIFATDTSGNAKLNLRSSSFTATYHGTPAENTRFAASSGYTGDGSTTYLDTGYVPATAGLNYAQNAACLGVYVMNNRTTGNEMVMMGAIEGGFNNGIAIVPCWAPPQAYIGINSNNTANPTLTSTARGMTSVVVRASSATEYFRNAASMATDTKATTGLCANSIFILGTNFNGSLFNSSPLIASTDTVGAAFIGGIMTSAEILKVHARVNGYMTALGVNVY